MGSEVGLGDSASSSEIPGAPSYKWKQRAYRAFVGAKNDDSYAIGAELVYSQNATVLSWALCWGVAGSVLGAVLTPATHLHPQLSGLLGAVVGAALGATFC